MIKYFVFLFEKPMDFEIKDNVFKIFLTPEPYIKQVKILNIEGNKVNKGKKDFESKQKHNEKVEMSIVAVRLKKLIMSKKILAKKYSCASIKYKKNGQNDQPNAL